MQIHRLQTKRNFSWGKKDRGSMLPPPLTPQPPDPDSGDFSWWGCRGPPDPPPVTINGAAHGASRGHKRRLQMKNNSETLTAAFCNRFTASQVRGVLCSSTLVSEERKKSEPVRFKTKGNRHPNCEIHRHRKTNPSPGALTQPQWLARGSCCVAVVLKQLTPTFHRRVTRAAEFLEAAATESPPELPQREEHLLVYQILLDPSRRADSGEERSHRAPTETPENRVSLSPLETRFEIREKTKWAREAQLPLRGPDLKDFG